MARVPSEHTQAAAVANTAAAARKRAAAPSFADLAGAFGPQGLEFDKAGKPNGYKYPKPKNAAERKKLNEKVYEMWNPQRKLAIQMGGEHNAGVASTILLDRRTGRRETLPAHLAEKKARKAGLVEAPRWRGKVVMQADAGGNLWKLVGERWVPA